MPRAFGPRVADEPAQRPAQELAPSVTEAADQAGASPASAAASQRPRRRTPLRRPAELAAKSLRQSDHIAPMPRLPESATLEQLQAHWETLGIDVASLRPETDGTIMPTTQPPLLDELDRGEPLLALPQINSGQPDVLSEISVGRTLGEGGMGVVKTADQRSLGREVAVKLVQGEANRGQRERELLREARVLGVLEHPNIVPVHALGRDADGTPMLVMKRVQGVSWGDVLRDPAHPAWERHQGDRLDFHLDVLMQVCNAVYFAHSKGIIHRDLKPDNVMIGAFGEVYVVDWGVAAALEQDPTGLLPRARDVRTVVGTPHYMAPEQAAADGSRISERTDVYLLGATLHECLVGRPRHSGDDSSVAAVLARAYSSEPVPYGADVPPELAKICNRATHKDPAQRHASPLELREALARFRRHRSVRSLITDATERLITLRQLLQVRGDQAPYDDVHRLFVECRFGFEQAQTQWPSNEEARRGLNQALELMAGYEIARRDAEAAAALMACMERPSPQLEQSLVQLQQQVAAEQTRILRLNRLEERLDPAVGARTRALVGGGMGLLATLMLLLCSLGQRLGLWTLTVGGLSGVLVVFVLLYSSVHLLRRRSLRSTLVNRRINNLVRLGLLLVLGTLGAALTLGLSVDQTAVLLMVPLAGIFGGVTVADEPRMAPSVVCAAVGLLVGALVPSIAVEVLALAVGCGVLNVVRVWLARARAAERC